ncbi:MAG: hypothetical protein ABJI96_00830 [Paracoccaceae bacterium]
MNMVKSSVLIIGLGLVSACTKPQPVQQGYVSSQARSQLPYHQDMSKVVRGEQDGCYYLMLDGSPQGYLSPFLQAFKAGKQICDPVSPAE